MVQIQQHLITVIQLMIQVIKPTIKSCQLKVKLLRLIIKVYHLMTKVCQLLITFLFVLFFSIMTKVYQISIIIYQQLTDEGLPSEDSGFSTTTKSVWLLTEAFTDRLPPERYWRDEYPTRRVCVLGWWWWIFPDVALSPPAWRAAMSAILMFHCYFKSQQSLHTPRLVHRKESRSGKSNRLPA